MPGEEKIFHDPRTGGRWVSKTPRPHAYAIRIIKHGGRLHVGLPRKLTDAIDLQRGDVVLIDLRGKEIVIERLKAVAEKRKDGVLCTSTK